MPPSDGDFQMVEENSGEGTVWSVRRLMGETPIEMVEIHGKETQLPPFIAIRIESIKKETFVVGSKRWERFR